MNLFQRCIGTGPRRLAMPALAVLLAGCQMGGNQAALEGELRARSEENTQLQLMIHDLEVELRECKRKLERQTRADDDGDGRAGAAGSGSKPQPPDIELGPPRQNDDDAAPAPKFNPRGQQPQAAPGPADAQSSQRRPGDLRVVRVTLDPRQTNGWDADPAAPGDEGLLVVVEPRNSAGELTPIAGQIAIAAYDAELLEKHAKSPGRGELAHIGTWHFNPQDAQTWFLEDGDGSKLHFELRWPEERPAGRQVRVYVRFITEDGRTLQSNWSVVVNHDGARDANVAEGGESPADVAPTNRSAVSPQSPPWHSALRDIGAVSRPEWKPYR